MREKEREKKIILNFKIFCIIDVKYKEISWRVRREGREGRKEK